MLLMSAIRRKLNLSRPKKLRKLSESQMRQAMPRSERMPSK